MLARMDITGASAIVTGGASGIGAAVARALAARGAIVVVADLNAEKGEALAADSEEQVASTLRRRPQFGECGRRHRTADRRLDLSCAGGHQLDRCA